MLVKMQVLFLSSEEPGLGITPEQLTLPQTPRYHTCTDSSI